jgi:hypothetical protein
MYWQRKVASQDFDSDTAARQGYVFAFAPFHAYALAHAASALCARCTAAAIPPCRVVSIGGGPAAGTLGALAALRLAAQEAGLCPPADAQSAVDVLDLYTGWAEQAHSTLIPTGLAADVAFHRFDLFRPLEATHAGLIARADLIVASKALSLTEFDVSPASAFVSALDAAPQGCRLLVFDNLPGVGRTEALLAALRASGWAVPVAFRSGAHKTEFLPLTKLRDYTPVAEAASWGKLSMEGAIRPLSAGAVLLLGAVKS